MNDIVVLKFGGSSLADNEKIMQAAQKVSLFFKQKKKVVVIVSAQGKTTDKLIQEAKEITATPAKRELDMLISTGEQMSCSKFAMCMQKLGYKAISLTGWQAGIYTNQNYTDAKIQTICSKRIVEELEKNQIVVIAGFQGISKQNDITTLGRDGSDTTALAIAAALKQKECYIFTDIDGIYNKDPNKYEDAYKIPYLSYEKMKELAKNGSKVLHDKCISIAEKYKIKIIVTSTFSKKDGSIVG